MQDHIQPNTIHEVPTLERNSKQNSPIVDLPTPKALPFRLIADFAVEVGSAEAFLAGTDLTEQERSFLLRILNDHEAFNRMCRLAIVSDLETFGGKYFEEEVDGPNAEDILACASPYLASEEREYWNRQWQEQPESLTAFLLEMFAKFCSSLKRAVVQDMTTGAMIPMRVNSRRHAERKAALAET